MPGPVYSDAIGCFSIGNSAIGVGPPCAPPVLGADVPAITRTIRSYLYEEYADDDDLQSFVASYNDLAQLFVDWFNALNLPIYTRSPVKGALLDWVAAGLYGIMRPPLGTGSDISQGPLDTYTFDELAIDDYRALQSIQFIPTTDDLFRRIITWHFDKGDGKQFTVRWLKRRIMQFLLGTDGIKFDVDQTYRISVSYGVAGQVNITFVKYRTTVVWDTCLDDVMFDERAYNDFELNVVDIGDQFEFAQAFKDAMDGGFLELPFQYNAVVTIQH